MKRLELLKQTGEQKENMNLEYQLEKDKLQLESDLLETRLRLKEKQQLLLALKSARQLSSSDVIKAQVDYDGLQRGIEALEALKKELF